mgnify:CR=1 FL=1
MIAKFQIMFFKGRVLKGVCLDTLKESELKKDKEYYLRKNYNEETENYLYKKALDVAIIYEDIKNLSNSKYNYLCLKSTYERYVKGYERYWTNDRTWKYNKWASR